MPDYIPGHLEKTMQHLIDHPEQHDQGNFFRCGTPGCIAGHGIFLAGLYQDYRGTGGSAQDYAAAIFGISEKDSDLLFYDSNSLEKLQLMVKDLLNGDSLADKWYHNHDERVGPAGAWADVQPIPGREQA